MEVNAEKKSAKFLQFVSFVLDREVFALDVMKVRGVERLKELVITSIPGMPDFIDGVISLRGTIIPIVDLRRRFRLPEKDHDKETRIILVELDRRLVIGLLVDKVNEVFQIQPGMVGGVPKLGRPSMDNRFIQGVTKRETGLTILLDVERIFSIEEAEELKALT